ncbi:hypothetical protein H920_15065 [Fukomys damarensis]|uniref:Uncharacterized protein n=1 Tax=Fukomys damarensis TaxID=885580 RepID=A0A091CZ15_FUKDA|nr:hypothetical protein H920_15065 [Fukomys damarensis]
MCGVSPRGTGDCQECPVHTVGSTSRRGLERAPGNVAALQLKQDPEGRWRAVPGTHLVVLTGTRRICEQKEDGDRDTTYVRGSDPSTLISSSACNEGCMLLSEHSYSSH